MRRKLSLVLLIICIVLTGCSTGQSKKSKTETYIIPNSYFRFTGLEAAEAVESCLELGNDFCSNAKEISEGMQLELTAEQLNNFIERNDEFVDELVKQFTSSNSLYKCVLNESYEKLTLYFDENISSTMQVKTILGIASNCGMNYMLLNNTTDWNVNIEIINCHTGKLVASVNIPDEEISYGAKEWAASYDDRR